MNRTQRRRRGPRPHIDFLAMVDDACRALGMTRTELEVACHLYPGVLTDWSFRLPLSSELEKVTAYLEDQLPAAVAA